jgi:hypothetical protein
MDAFQLTCSRCNAEMRGTAAQTAALTNCLHCGAGREWIAVVQADGSRVPLAAPRQYAHPYAHPYPQYPNAHYPNGGFAAGAAQPPLYAPQSPYYGGPYAANGPWGYYPPAPRRNGVAVAGFVTSLCSVVFCAVPGLGLLAAMTGLGLSIGGTAAAGRVGGKHRGLGVAGIVLASVGLVGSIATISTDTKRASCHSCPAQKTVPQHTPRDDYEQDF